MRSTLLLPILLLAVSASTKGNEERDLQCALTHGLFAPPDSPEHRKYAPDRRIDVQHLILDVTPDFENRRVSGEATLIFKPIAKPLAQLELAAVKLDVDTLTASAPIREYHVTDESIQITFTNPIPAGEETRVTVVYEATPEKGLYFRTPEMGYPEGETQIWTQGETHEAPHWYPCYDYPNEKFTSEVICHLPEEMIALSNGRLISKEEDPGADEVVYHWRQEKPHVNYLIALVAGYFEKIEDQYKDIPLAFYASPSNIEQAMNSFRYTADMMAYFEEEIGVPYPWVKYYQVCIKDPHFGGMENTSLTTLTERTLFSDATENIRSSQTLVAHELAHQWFGDLVTCKDWSHLWLNEGFATYYAHLYDGYKNGSDAMLYGLYQDAERRILHRNDPTPIVWREYNRPGDQFSYRAYPKGSWILHMLRSQLGEDLYRRCIQEYLERHEYEAHAAGDGEPEHDDGQERPTERPPGQIDHDEDEHRRCVVLEPERAARAVDVQRLEVQRHVDRRRCDVDETQRQQAGVEPVPGPEGFLELRDQPAATVRLGHVHQLGKDVQFQNPTEEDDTVLRARDRLIVRVGDNDYPEEHRTADEEIPHRD
jgi:aminopeptidase N